MQKKDGFKVATYESSTLSGENFIKDFETLIWDYVGKLRATDSAEIASDLAAYLAYCSYVSRNAKELGVSNFSGEYSIDNAKNNLGNKYVAQQFVDQYANLTAPDCNLPSFTGIELQAHDLSAAIKEWCELLVNSKLGLLDSKDTFEVAKNIWKVLARVTTSERWGATRMSSSSSVSVATAMARLAQVEEKRVLDFVCGDGVFLSSAAASGATAVVGKDIDVAAMVRAKILCFFANPKCDASIEEADVLKASVNDNEKFDRVLAAAPMGMQLKDYEVGDGTYASTVYEKGIGALPAHSKFIEDYCIAKALTSLSPDGVAVFQTSASFLFHQQKGRKLLRKSLVENGHVRAVIELPGGCVPCTSVKSALLVLDKNASSEGVLIVDMDSKALNGLGYISKSRTKCEITDVGIDWLEDILASREEIPLVSTVVSPETLKENEYGLYYSAYGTVFDYEQALKNTRSTGAIRADIEEANKTVEELNARIDSILAALKKDGE